MKLWIRGSNLERLKDPNFDAGLVQFFSYKPVYKNAVQVEITEVEVKPK